MSRNRKVPIQRDFSAHVKRSWLFAASAWSLMFGLVILVTLSNRGNHKTPPLKPEPSFVAQAPAKPVPPPSPAQSNVPTPAVSNPASGTVQPALPTQSGGVPVSPAQAAAVGPKILADFDRIPGLFQQAETSHRSEDWQAALDSAEKVVAALKEQPAKNPADRQLIKDFMYYPLVHLGIGRAFLKDNKHPAQPLFNEILESCEMQPNAKAYVLIEKARDLLNQYPEEPENERRDALKVILDTYEQSSKALAKAQKPAPEVAYSLASGWASTHRRFVMDKKRYLASATAQESAAADIAKDSPNNQADQDNWAAKKKQLEEVLGHVQETKRLAAQVSKILDQNPELDKSGLRRQRLQQANAQLEDEIENKDKSDIELKAEGKKTDF